MRVCFIAILTICSLVGCEVFFGFFFFVVVVVGDGERWGGGGCLRGVWGWVSGCPRGNVAHASSQFSALFYTDLALFCLVREDCAVWSFT